MAVALYARVSTVKQAEKDLSIPDQLRQMRDWCKAHGHAVAMEYIEPGASATDDRRPMFQQMIADATSAAAPFDSIIVHSRSRFFRDLLECLSYESRLRRAGVRVISITQQTSDDPAGEMASKIFSLFDEYQSKENGKHTLRAMKENARQGFFNGSRPMFGFKTVEAENVGNKGQRKKRLAVDPAEAATVRTIYALYLEGHAGQSLGSKGVAYHLNERGVSYRGSRWTRGRIHQILSEPAYRGDYYFNRHDPRAGKLKPAGEWIKSEVEAIIDAETFERVRARRAARAPAQVPPRVVNSPTLLTGLIKCGCCGAGMTLATGKGGRYRYYKCNTRIAKGTTYCTSRTVPMEKLDTAVLTSLADKVFTPARTQAMLKALQSHLKDSRAGEDSQVKNLAKELEQLAKATERLYEAVEQGVLALNDSLKERAHKLQARRQELLLQMAALKDKASIPAALLRPKHALAFTRALREKFFANRGFAKEYLRLLVDEIRVEDKQVAMSGSYVALATAVAAMKPGGTVPRFAPNWLPDLGSNQEPAD